MKYLKLYENFDWSDEDFDIEDESALEIIGNQYFTDFLIDRDLYDKFVESAIICHHKRYKIHSIKEINDIIQSHGLLHIINRIINWEYAYDLTTVKWEPINREWNELCLQNPLYKFPEL